LIISRKISKSHQISNVIPKRWYALSIHVRIFRINVRILYAFMYFQRDVCTLQRGVCILDACTYFSQRYTCCRLLFVFYKYMYVFCIMYVLSNRCTYYRFMYVFWKRCASCCWRVCKRWSARDRRTEEEEEEVHSNVVSSALVFWFLDCVIVRFLLHNCVTHHVFKCSLVRFESSLYISGAPGNNNGRRQEQFLSVAIHAGDGFSTNRTLRLRSPQGQGSWLSSSVPSFFGWRKACERGN
jgi:hypothetical protein